MVQERLQELLFIARFSSDVLTQQLNCLFLTSLRRFHTLLPSQDFVELDTQSRNANDRVEHLDVLVYFRTILVVS